jgi:hypothetical protein
VINNVLAEQLWRRPRTGWVSRYGDKNASHGNGISATEIPWTLDGKIRSRTPSAPSPSMKTATVLCAIAALSGMVASLAVNSTSEQPPSSDLGWPPNTNVTAASPDGAMLSDGKGTRGLPNMILQGERANSPSSPVQPGSSSRVPKSKGVCRADDERGEDSDDHCAGLYG